MILLALIFFAAYFCTKECEKYGKAIELAQEKGLEPKSEDIFFAIAFGLAGLANGGYLLYIILVYIL